MMASDIRDAAAKAAREWAHDHHECRLMIPDSRDSYAAGYLRGYEAAKAEVAEEVAGESI